MTFLYIMLSLNFISIFLFCLSIGNKNTEKFTYKQTLPVSPWLHCLLFYWCHCPFQLLLKWQCTTIFSDLMLLYEVLCHRFCKSPAGLNLLNTIIHDIFIVLNIAFYILCSEVCWCFLATQGSFTEVYKLSVVLLLGLSLPNRISSQEKNT